MSFPPLFSLVPDLRPMCCGDPVGMAMVARTCRTAASMWYRPRGTRILVLEAACKLQHLDLVRWLLWHDGRDGGGVAYHDMALFRCVIRAMHVGNYGIFATMMNETEAPQRFSRACRLQCRELFLSRPLDISDWPDVEKLLLPLQQAAGSAGAYDVAMHGPDQTSRWLPLPRGVLGPRRYFHQVPRQWEEETETVMRRLPQISARRARETVAACRGDVTAAIRWLTFS